MTTTLYLDFDGVLHPDAVYVAKAGGLELRAPGKILMHADILIVALGYHPEVEVILSTSWVNHFGFCKTKKKLPQALRDRVTGTTWCEDRQVGTYSYSRFHKLTRFQQIWAHVFRNGITNWVALDDLHSGSEPWPAEHREHLILCDGKTGLGDTEVQAALNTALLERQYGE
ncbi:MAG TPA: HAD domain-containing protein [Methylotenera sp.]|jgi:hypothetical protein